MRVGIPILIALLLCGCKKQEAGVAEPPESSAAPQRVATEAAAPQDLRGMGYAGAKASPAAPAANRAPAGNPAPAANRAPALPRKLIRTVDLVLEVKDSPVVAKKVESLVSGMGGFVATSDTQRVGDFLRYTLTVRVPVERYEQALNAIRGLAVRVNREHQQVEDVTDQYIDLDARRRTLEATETELRGLLAESRQRGRKVGEIMEVYQQLVEIRSQIEQIQGQINSFDKRAALSTINLELVPTEAAVPVADTSWQPSDTVRSSFRRLVAFLRWLMDFLIYALIVLVPVGVVIVAGFFLLRWLWRRLGRPLSRRRELPVPPPPDGGPAGG
jgi:chemotaxis protein histidine kinase CheA